MDLIPTPEQVVSAAGNVAHTVLYGGLADLRPMPRTLIDDGVLREVYHYRPAVDVAENGDPVLLVHAGEGTEEDVVPQVRLLIQERPADGSNGDLLVRSNAIDVL